MVQIGNAKGEYRGTGYRNDAELKAWLAKRPSEAALEPELPLTMRFAFTRSRA
jgi:L-fuconolactonase